MKKVQEFSTGDALPKNPLWQRVLLPGVHYFLGLVWLLIMLGMHYHSIMQHVNGRDFNAYYAAAHYALSAPEKLYDYASYCWPRNGCLPYINPPTSVIFLLPLALFSFSGAYFAWVFLNLFISYFIIKRVRTLAEILGIGQYKNLCASMVVGMSAWPYVFYEGQVSIILCLAMVLLLVHWHKSEYKFAGFWLALALCIKPHFFIPFLFYLAGYKHYKLFRYCFAWVALFVALSVMLLGFQSWFDFFVRLHGQNFQTVSAFDTMINFRGILSEIFVDMPYWQFIADISFLIYAVVIIGCFFLGWYQRKTSASLEVALPLVFLLSWFFSPWLHTQDFYELLMVGILMLAYLTKLNRAYLLLLPYLLAAFAPPVFYTLIEYACRIALVLSLGLAFYIMRSAKPLTAQPIFL